MSSVDSSGTHCRHGPDQLTEALDFTGDAGNQLTKQQGSL